MRYTPENSGRQKNKTSKAKKPKKTPVFTPQFVCLSQKIIKIITIKPTIATPQKI